jgi:hypothetical protein
MLDGNIIKPFTKRQYINALKGHLFIRDLLFLPDKDMVSNDIFIFFYLVILLSALSFTLKKSG